MDSEDKNVAIYARVSTEMQAEEELPITGQVEECQRFAASIGFLLFRHKTGLLAAR